VIVFPEVALPEVALPEVELRIIGVAAGGVAIAGVGAWCVPVDGVDVMNQFQDFLGHGLNRTIRRMKVVW
jgi:hypothetical protein